jgi:predicted dehydrogenase
MNTGAKLRVGVVGLIHDHVWTNLTQLQESPYGDLIAAADTNQVLLDKVQAEYNCQQIFDSFHTMLEEVPLDAIYVYLDNAGSVEVVKSAAEKGIHAMVEKPMAATLGGADQMLSAARVHDTYLMVNWPFAWRSGVVKALELAKSGLIGDLFSVKYRAAHAGPKEYGCTPFFYNWLYDQSKNGAGAIIDYCCYGAVLARYLLGQPNRVFGMAERLQKDYTLVDDNAVIVMQWPHAVAISEASWTQIGDMTSYETLIYGREGTLKVERGQNGTLWHATRENPDGVELEVSPIPYENTTASNYFLNRIMEGEPIQGLCNPNISRDAQEILEAGLLSSIKGKRMTLPLPILNRK